MQCDVQGVMQPTLPTLIRAAPCSARSGPPPAWPMQRTSPCCWTPSLMTLPGRADMLSPGLLPAHCNTQPDVLYLTFFARTAILTSGCSQQFCGESRPCDEALLDLKPPAGSLILFKHGCTLVWHSPCPGWCVKEASPAGPQSGCTIEVCMPEGIGFRLCSYALRL